MRKILIILLIVGLNSCESLLDIDPSDAYSVDTYWVSEANYEAALAGVYKNLHSNFEVISGEFEMITPNSYTILETNEIAMGVALATTGSFQSYWSWGYRGIGRANTIIYQIDYAPKQMTESIKNQIKGEALFLRAYFYSFLTDKFKDIPLITEPPNADIHADRARSPKQEVVSLIIDDLTEAANLLPSTARNTGRATKGAALALKARTLLYNEKWTEAAQAAKKVIDLEVYDLFPDYRGMYLPENENNNEVIFDVQYQLPFETHSGDRRIYTANRHSPLKNLVDAYLMTDGKTITESNLYDPNHPYENRDPRLHQTIFIQGYPFNGKITQARDVHVTGYGQKKLTSKTDNESINIPPGQSDLNIILIRYAEVLLTYAEALNEAGTAPNSEVYWALNQIRTRPTVEMPEIEPGLNKEQMREVIRFERRIELALEGLFYSDIRRWRIAEIVNNGPVRNSQGEVIEIRSFNKDRDYLWPIPHNEIQENPNLTQNPGW